METFLQTTINGLASGSIYALGAVGLSLVYAILKLVNFAHGDFMTLGGYVAFAVNVSLGMPLVLAAAISIVAIAAVGLLTEAAIWRPMRNRGAGIMQLLLLSLGLAFVMRNLMLFVWGAEERQLSIDTTRTFDLGIVRVSLIQVIVIATAAVMLVLLGVGLKYTYIGKSMRALSDSFDLAEVSGIDTRRVVTYTWLVGAGLAGLAGMLAAIFTILTPETGWLLLLGIFAAVILGGIGNPFGALIGGIALGLVQEWSTNVVAATYKEAIGFLLLILALLLRPNGIFGHSTRTA
jgi:neutral amino acid transport system permease protein